MPVQHLPRRAMLALPLAAGLAPRVRAQAARATTIVVPFAAGGGVDLATRTVAERASAILGRRIVIENRGGGSTIPATQAVVRAAPDGATLLAAPTTMVINPAVRNDLPYDWATDLTPIILFTRLPFVVVTRPDFPAATMQDLARAARAAAQPIAFGSGGTGTVAHLAGEFFALRAEARMLHVPYRGEAPALADVLGGNLGVMFSSLAAASGQIRSGALKPLAVTTGARVSSLPDVPTVAEQGFAGYDVSAWVALAGPRGLPAPLVAEFAAAVGEALRDPAVRERLATLGAEPAGETGEALVAFMRRDAGLWADVIRRAGVRVE
jgi:tripartite-type tricarboxylate transporter receptor subunit TctC